MCRDHKDYWYANMVCRILMFMRPFGLLLWKPPGPASPQGCSAQGTRDRVEVRLHVPHEPFAEKGGFNRPDPQIRILRFVGFVIPRNQSRILDPPMAFFTASSNAFLCGWKGHIETELPVMWASLHVQWTALRRPLCRRPVSYEHEECTEKTRSQKGGEPP